MEPYQVWETEKLLELYESDLRAFYLIWGSKNGELLKWDAPKGGLSGKIDATDGLARRIKLIYRFLKVRGVEGLESKNG